MRNIGATQIDNGYLFEFELPEGDVQVTVTYYDTVKAEIVNDSHEWKTYPLSENEQDYFIGLKNDFIKKREVAIKVASTIRECNYKVQQTIKKALESIDNKDLHISLVDALRDMKSVEIDTHNLDNVYHDLYKCQKSEITI